MLFWASFIRPRHVTKKLTRRSRPPGNSSRNLLLTSLKNTSASSSYTWPSPGETRARIYPLHNEKRLPFSSARTAASLLGPSTLLTMPLQVLLHGLYLVRVRRAKSSLVVDIDDIGVLEMDNHIGVMVA